MSSTITIPSRCHAYPNEWEGEQNAGIPYAFNDRIEILTWREIEEVERSGRSDHRSYAETPTQWPGEQHPVAPLMEARPGKTGSVRSMRVGGEATSASQGSGPGEQHAGEHSNTLRQLPHRTPLEGGESEAEESPAFLRRLREALGSQPLRNPSDTPEEVWERSTCEEKDWIRVAAIRGVWHSEWPGVPRVAVGIAKRADRLKAIGNGQVPAAAALAWNTLHERIQRRLKP